MGKLDEQAKPRIPLVAKGAVTALVTVSLVGSSIGVAAASQISREDVVKNLIEGSDGAVDVDAVLEALEDADFSGADVLAAYLGGDAIDGEDVFEIDVESLARIDANLADEISLLQESLAAEKVEQDNAAAGEEDADASSDEEAADEFSPEISEDAADESLAAEDGAEAAQDAEEAAADEGEAGEADGADGADEAEAYDESGDGGDGATSDVATDGAEDGEDEALATQWTYDGDATYTPHNVGVSLTTQKFIAVIGEQAREVAQESDLYASVMIAQAILESSSGNSSLASDYNNLFGIKGSYEGQSAVMRTSEDDGTGQTYSTFAVFRSYESIQDSLADYADLLTSGMGSYYAQVWKSNADTYVDACDYLEGHYATDTSYSEKLQALIEAYDLTRYDEPLDYEMVYTHTVEVVDEETGETVAEERDLVDLVAELTSHLGEDYVWGGTQPGGFDCSGLVQYCYRSALGIGLPRTAAQQALSTYGEDVDFDDLHMGDLLFFTDDDGAVTHVAVYLGEGCYIHAPQTGDVVKVTSMTEYMPTFAKRIVSTQDAQPAEVDQVDEADIDLDPAIYAELSLTEAVFETRDYVDALSQQLVASVEVQLEEGEEE